MRWETSGEVDIRNIAHTPMQKNGTMLAAATSFIRKCYHE